MPLEATRDILINSMVFYQSTTYKEDFGNFTFGKLPEPRQWNEIPKRQKICPEFKCVETMTNIKRGSRIPIDMFIKPKEIVQTKPMDVQQPYQKQNLDAEIEEARRIRPRVIMTPAVPVDDMPPEQRNTVLKDAYTTSYEAAAREALPPLNTNVAPLALHVAPARPISLPKLRQPYVAPEWRMESLKWDRQGLRSYVDPDKEFWTRRPASKCGVCKHTEELAKQSKS